MKRNKKGFTLVELLLVLSIGAVLLTISTNRFILNTAVANNNNNKQIDLQSGVSATMEMIKNTLRKTTQVHLVDKSVYDPDLSIAELEGKGLDKKYNYIAIRKDPATGEKTLVNLLYNKTKNGGAGGFEVVPIIATDKGDRVRPVNVNFALDLYAGDDEYKDKMKKNIINVKVTGTARDVDQAGNFTNSQDDKIFFLQEDIFLQNTNQILVSKHMKGGLADVTAIAYDTGVIEKEGTETVSSMSFVFIIDSSGSMAFSMNANNNAGGYHHSRKKIARDSIHNFIEKLDAEGKSKGIDINAYIFTYGTNVMIDTISAKGKYLYDLDTLTTDPNKKYGPFKLGKLAKEADIDAIKDHLDNDSKCAMKKEIRSASTNTGKALLQGLEILNQLYEKNSDERRFLILLTDGNPTMVYANLRQRAIIREDLDSVDELITPVYSRYRREENEIINLESYKKRIIGEDYDLKNAYYYNTSLTSNQNRDYYYSVTALDYVRRVTEFSAGNNKITSFDKAYLIGFSGIPKDKEMLGLEGKNYGSYGSIRKFLALEGTANEKKNTVLTYDADSSAALNSAFADITKSIGDVMGAFDGPDKLRR